MLVNFDKNNKKKVENKIKEVEDKLAQFKYNEESYMEGLDKQQAELTELIREFKIIAEYMDIPELIDISKKFEKINLENFKYVLALKSVKNYLRSTRSNIVFRLMAEKVAKSK